MVVGGRYRLESILGQGGMAVVWRAEHTETGRIVALKLVRPELAAHDTAREMFVREARVASRVGRSEHIVDVLDAGVDPELGLPFLAMELLEGETLDATLGRSGAPPREIAISLLEQIAEALDQAHAAGVIHRDLKPQNLFVTQGRQGPRIKVLELSRNFGKEIALTAGIDAAIGDAVVPIDADLQDPPELIGEMIDAMQRLDRDATVGAIVLTLDDKTIEEVPLQALDAVDEGSLFSRLYDEFMLLFE